MEKIKMYIVLIIFFLMTAGVWLIWPAVDGFLDTENYENRNLSEFPPFSMENISDYPSEVESWWDDRIPFRNQLIRLNSKINYYLLDTSPNPNVIKGKNGWLFYANDRDGSPINGCYKGENLLSEDQLEELADSLCASRDNLAAEGCDFVIFIVPNKERVCADEMPDYYGNPAGNYAVLQIYSYLKTHTDIKIIYPVSEMMDARQYYTAENLYHRTDTHWNELGAYIAMEPLFDAVDINMPTIGSDGVKIEAESDTAGDLANMINLGNSIDAGMTYRAVGYPDHEMTNEIWDFANVFIYHTHDGDSRRLFVERDSFGSAMSDIMGSQFSYSYMRHKNSYDNSQVKKVKPDLFILESVERYAPNALENFHYE